MLSPPNRLRKAADIQEVLKRGRKVRLGMASVSICNRPKDHTARAAIVVGKRVHKSAVVRHRVQRILRQVSRKIIKQEPYGYDMVVIANPDSLQVTSAVELESIVNEVTTFIKKKIRE